MNVMTTSLLFIGLSWTWTCFISVLIWLLWTVAGLGTCYFGFLPAAWQSMPLLHVMGVLLLFTLLRGLIQGLQLKMEA